MASPISQTLHTTDAEKVIGSTLILGGATMAAFAAKSIIAAGFAAHLIPLIGTIVGIALMVLGTMLFCFAWRRDLGTAGIEWIPQQALAPPLPLLQPLLPDEKKNRLHLNEQRP